MSKLRYHSKINYDLQGTLLKYLEISLISDMLTLLFLRKKKIEMKNEKLCFTFATSEISVTIVIKKNSFDHYFQQQILEQRKITPFLCLYLLKLL